MSQSLASKIEAANSRFTAKGDFDAVAEYFTPDHVAQLTDEDMPGSHDLGLRPPVI